ncbi:MAG: hypothetical protein H7259_04160 [Cytophagales bacterium]|nr:hypothetical protein [Cytophaga sp.]
MIKTPVILSVILLLLTVLLEFVFIKFHLFELLPHIGILFHIAGGVSMAVGIYYFYYLYMMRLPWFLQALFVIGITSMAAVGWEGFEWVLGFYKGKRYQGSLQNTMEDMYFSISGGVLACIGILWIEYKKKKRI